MAETYAGSPAAPSRERATTSDATGNRIEPTPRVARAAAYHAQLVQELRPPRTLAILVAKSVSAARIELFGAATRATLEEAAENTNPGGLFWAFHTASEYPSVLAF